MKFSSINLLKNQTKQVEKVFSRPSRNRTYIRNLEGFCPNPLDDRPIIRLWVIQDLNL